MLSQEEIYDLDTETLQHRIQEVEQLAIQCSKAESSNLRRLLELAKLELEEREALQLCQLFEKKFSSYNFLYLDDPKTSVRVQPPFQIEPLAQSRSRVPVKVFTIPKPDFLKVKVRPKVIPKPSPLPAIRVSNNFESTNHRRRATSIALRPIHKLPTKLRQSTHNIVLQQKVPTKQPTHREEPQKSTLNTVKNNMRFVQNEYSISSDQEAEEGEIFKPQLIVLKSELLKTQCGQEVQTQKYQSAQATQVHVFSQQSYKTQQNNSCVLQTQVVATEQLWVQHQIEPQTNLIICEPTKIISPTYENTLDYFRFTHASKKMRQPEVDKTKHTFICQQISPGQQLHTVQTPEILEEIQMELSNQLAPMSTTELPLCFTERVQKQLSQDRTPDRPTTQHGPKKLKIQLKPVRTTTLVRQLPEPVIVYHDMIPTFDDLFHPQAQVFQTMKFLLNILTQHLKVNKGCQPQQNCDSVQNRYELISRHRHLVDIKLDKPRRLDNDQPPCVPAQCSMYFRVVKTKQQVYQIITNTFSKINWLQLPHGLNLKHSWNLLWTWSKPQIDFKSLIYFQKVNHFPSNKHLSRKDLLKKNIEKIKRLGTKISAIFDIIPETYLLPGEADQFIQQFHLCSKQKLNIWIMKPIGQSRGRGIKLISSPSEVEYQQPVVLQKYLKDPLLLDGTKFDMRIYVLVTSINPLQAYVYKEGFARLSTQKYSLDDLSNNMVHLTNFAIQRQNLKQQQRQSIGGSKISLKMLKTKLESRGIVWNRIWVQVVEVIIKSLIACMNEIPQNPNCFELFGYDIIVDSNLKCWLLQVNSSPSLEREFALDELIKQQLIEDIMQLLDPPQFDRLRLKEVLERRIREKQGRKSYLNTNNNSTHQLNLDLYYILHGKPLRRYGQAPASNNWQCLAPSETYFRHIKALQAYKLTNIIK